MKIAIFFVANVLRGELYFVVIRQYMSSPGWKEKLDEEKWRVGVILPKRDSDPEIVKAKDVTITEVRIITPRQLPYISPNGSLFRV